MRLKHSQLYRERNEKICQLVKEGRHGEVFRKYQLCHKWVNAILRENGMSERVTPKYYNYYGV